jgi:hypothetical protein
MFIVDLKCDSGHRFEGWYETSAEFETIRDDGELTCPLCGSASIERLLSTGAIKTTKTEARHKPSMPLEMQKQLAKVVQHVRQTHEDVGDQFADKAIAMSRGEEEARPIRGQSDAEGEKRMTEEGVGFLKLPIPDIEQN